MSGRPLSESDAPITPVPHKRKIVAGVCRYCQCTEKKRCTLTGDLFEGGNTIPCQWVTGSASLELRPRTLCTAPRCVKRFWKEHHKPNPKKEVHVYE